MTVTATAIGSSPSDKARVVCGRLDASSHAATLLTDAIALCEEHDAELFVVWVLEPRVFQDPFPGSAGAVGTFGLLTVLHTAVERARRAGIAATSAVRIGLREVVLRHEAGAAGTMAAFRLDRDGTDLPERLRRPDEAARPSPRR